MPTKRCCCGPCYTYSEDFIRDPSNAEELEPDWETCSGTLDWSEWTLTPGALTNTVANAVLVLKHMVGNPYGILTGEIEAIAGVIYRIHVFYGEVDDACGDSDTIVEIEFIEEDEGVIRILQNEVMVEEAEFSPPTGDVLFTICVGDRMIEAATDSSDTIRYCVEATNYWFAIEGETTGTVWNQIDYSDQWEHDKRCPRCSKHCCFQGHNGVIAGFDIILHGVADGTDCDECFEELPSFRVELSADDDKCDCLLTFIVNPDSENPDDHYVDGPHPCTTLGLGGRSLPSVTMDCRFGDIIWTLDFVPEWTTETPVQFTKTFVAGTAPTAILDTHLDVFDSGDGESCNYDDAWIEFVPVVVRGCCSEPNEEVSATVSREMAISEHPAFLETLRSHKIDTDTGAGDTAQRLLADRRHKPLYPELRRFLRLWSCKRKEAADMANRWYPY